MYKNIEILKDGGMGKHIDHPYDFSNSGTELLNIFKKTVISIKNGNAIVKIDGINVTLRLVNGKFVLDRKSAKLLDIQGIHVNNLEERFGKNHGFIKIGKVILDLFNASYTYTYGELQKLGLTENENIMINMDYVDGQSNVINYERNFLAIHGLGEIFIKNVNKDGVIKSRDTREIEYNQSTLNTFIKKLNVIANEHGFTVIGNVPVKLNNHINFDDILNESITIFNETKLLKEHVECVKTILKPLITKSNFLDVLHNKNNSIERSKLINDTVVYLTTMKIGQEILNNCTSDLGDLNKHEGIIVKDSTTYNKPYKITGDFILDGMNSKFEKRIVL